MNREAQIKRALREIAPWALSIARDAQRSELVLGDDVLRSWLPRRASANQVVGSTRWRRAGDQAVARSHELPRGVELRTSDAQHNGGSYYWAWPAEGLIFTIKQHAHRDDDRPDVLQLQLGQILEEAEVTFATEVVVYLSIPAHGNPAFEVSTTGKGVQAYDIEALLREDVRDDRSVNDSVDTRDAPSSGTHIGSDLDEQAKEEDAPASDQDG